MGLSRLTTHRCSWCVYASTWLQGRELTTIAEVLRAMSDHDAFSGRDQVMLFTRPPPHPSSLPPYLLELQDSIRSLLSTRLPPDEVETALDQSLARQVILNLYPPGQGISPHIDLPNRYADGIIGISLTGGTNMVFAHEGKRLRHEVYLPERTVYVMTGECRWEWSHGIEGRLSDLVQGHDGVETKLRSTRVSVTFRWMKEGADLLA
jgi:alkylated DNA repair dioxygenase AlkB